MRGMSLFFSTSWSIRGNFARSTPEIMSRRSDTVPVLGLDGHHGREPLIIVQISSPLLNLLTQKAFLLEFVHLCDEDKQQNL